MNNNSSLSNCNDDLSLKNLVLWTVEPIERMKWLAMSCESVWSLRGTAVLSQIYSYVNYAGGDIYLKKVLEEISKPFLFFVRNWIMYGDLQDPFKEFFVNILDQIHDDDIWTLKYQLVYKNIPNFLNRNLAIKIFEIGKCIHFIKTYCGETDYNLSKIKLILIEQITNYYNTLREEGNKMDIVMEDNSNVNGVRNINPLSNFNNLEHNQNNNDNNNQSQVNNNNQSQVNNRQNNTLNTTMNKEQKDNNQFFDINSYQSCLDFLNSLDTFNNESPNYQNQNMSYNNNNNSNQYIMVDQNKNTTTNFLSALLIQLDLLHSLINKELINILYTKFNFKENLVSLNRYLLLGQGDMMQSLMEGLFEELKKPANHIYKHNLQANLETAIRATNAQYNDKECLKKLNIKLMDPNAGDIGWDIFSLEYNVDVPLTVIFNKNLLKQYQKLFFFFWKLKRIEFSQNQQVWRKFMTYSHTFKKNFEPMRKVIQRSMLFNQQVVHFINNLHNFLALEVLETQYKKIIDVLPSITSLDELINVHRKFVENITQQTLLNSDYSSINKKILQIFDLIIRFRTALDVLTTTLLEGHYENMNNADLSDSLNFNKIFSTESSIQIYRLFNDFKKEVTELIETIEYFGKGNLKYLAMKLDYNYYYTILQKDKESQEQQKMIEQINREEQIQRQNEIQRRQIINQNYAELGVSKNLEEEDGGEEDFKEDPSGVGNDIEDIEGDAGNEEEEIGDSRRHNETSENNEIENNSHSNDEDNNEDYNDGDDNINMNANVANINISSSSLNHSRGNMMNRSNLQNSNISSKHNMSRHNDTNNDDGY